MRKLILFLVALLLCLETFGQAYSRNIRYRSYGGSVSAMNYVGEVDPTAMPWGPSVVHTRYNIGLEALQRITPSWSIRGAASYGRIGGSDHDNASYEEADVHRRVRNLSFRNQIFELKCDVLYDLRGNRGSFLKRPDYVPYVFVGLAYFHHNPEARAPSDYGGGWVALNQLQTEGRSYSLNQVALPVGLGFRYKLGKRWDLAFEMGWRFTLTDYLDDVSGTYVDRGTFGDNPLAVAMADRSMEGLTQDPALADWVIQNQGFNTSDGYVTVNGFGRAGDQRGDPNRKDVYIVTGFHLTYIFNDVICPRPPKFR